MAKKRDITEDNAIDYGEGEGGVGLASEEQGGASRFIVKLLTYAVGVIIGLILVVVTTYFSVKIITRSQQVRDFADETGVYDTKPAILDYMKTIPQIRGRTADVTAHSLVVSIELGYRQGNVALLAELAAREPQLTDMVRSFFSQKTAAELTPDREAKIKVELRESINRILGEGRIEDVVFTEFQVYEFF